MTELGHILIGTPHFVTKSLLMRLRNKECGSQTMIQQNEPVG
jgi:hypothetical protein